MAYSGLSCFYEYFIISLPGVLRLLLILDYWNDPSAFPKLSIAVNPIVRFLSYNFLITFNSFLNLMILRVFREFP